MTIVEIYALVVLTLWFAPLYGWVLLVSSWARSMPVLWAVLPPLGLAIGERIAFGTGYCWDMVKYRIGGFIVEGFDTNPHDSEALFNPLVLLNPARFVTTPGLWLGLVAAMAFLAGAVWMRRNRDLG